MKTFTRYLIAAGMIFSAVTSHASLVTSAGEITNQSIIDFDAEPPLAGVPGPIQIGGAIGADVTLDGVPNSGFFINSPGWGLCENGTWDDTMTFAGANDARPGTMRIALNDGPVSAVGGFINHAPCDSPTLVISAYDTGMVLLETYDITADAVTPGGLNAGVFRGISRPVADIAYFEIAGGVPVLDDITFGDAVADLTISKTDSMDPATAGAALTYTVRVDNIGNAPADGVTVTDTLPAGVTLVSTSGCAEDPTGVPTCSLGIIGAGSFAEFSVDVMVDPSATGLITNNVSVITSSVESDVANNSTAEDTAVAAEADLSITKMDSSDPIISGGNQVLVYTIEVTNAGPSDATNVIVTDSLSPLAIFQSTSGCQNDPVGVPDCQLGTITAGASASYTISVQLLRSSGTISNAASVVSDVSDPNVANNSVVETTDVTAIPIPTLNNLGLLMLVLLTAGFGWVSFRRIT